MARGGVADGPPLPSRLPRLFISESADRAAPQHADVDVEVQHRYSEYSGALSELSSPPRRVKYRY